MINLRLKTKYLCVVDLEGTCWDKDVIKQRQETEIIEIGAVLISSNNLETVDEFQSFVRPTLNPQLSDFCKFLTSISQEDVDAAPVFKDMYDKFHAWLSERDSGLTLMASQGVFDYRQIHKECQRHGLAFPFRGDHLNLKEHHGYKMGWSSRGIGQLKAASRLGVEVKGTAHRGIDDARTAVEILRKVGYAGAGGPGYRLTPHEVIRTKAS